MDVSDEESVDLTGLIPIFLDAARSEDNMLGLMGRITAYTFAIAYESSRDIRIEYANELIKMVGDVK
jgi:hypothetical protein